MSAILAFDPLSASKSLQKSGFTPEQSDAIALSLCSAIQEVIDSRQLVTRADLLEQTEELQKDIAELRESTQKDIADLKIAMVQQNAAMEKQITQLKMEIATNK